MQEADATHTLSETHARAAAHLQIHDHKARQLGLCQRASAVQGCQRCWEVQRSAHWPRAARLLPCLRFVHRRAVCHRLRGLQRRERRRQRRTRALHSGCKVCACAALRACELSCAVASRLPFSQPMLPGCLSRRLSLGLAFYRCRKLLAGLCK